MCGVQRTGGRPLISSQALALAVRSSLGLTSIGPFEQTLKHLLNWADRSKAMATDHVTIQTELLQAGIYIIYYYSQNSDHVKLQLDADHRRAACYVLSATVIGTAPNCNTNKC